MNNASPNDHADATTSAADRSPTPHSADALREAGRDFWWNRDFIELMSRRLRLGQCRQILDVGCGRGHWSRCLSRVLPPEAQVVGIDREPTWIVDAGTLARQAGLDGRFRYQPGVAETLPFADSSFDLATCQTLLIHVPDVKRVLREMLRVVVPGGLLLAAEPSNFCQSLRWNSLADEELNKPDGIETLLRVARFYLVCGKGKAALGEGLSAVGDLLPGYFNALGMSDIRVYQTDKASVMFTPYESEDQRVELADTLQIIADERYIWRETESRRYFLAGGGTEVEFADFWKWAMHDNARLKEALAQGRFHAAGGHSQYLVSGRKPLS